LLKPGGNLLITAPFCSLTHFAPYHYYTGFNRFFYEKHLPDNDFEIVDLQLNGNFFEFLGQEIRRVGYIADRYGGKKISWLDKIWQKAALWRLQRLSSEDQGSSELLNFGIHVFAKKSPGAP
jgi:hypothetical protein